MPNAIADKEIRDWLAVITAKGAYVWAIFDCCHSGSMTRTDEDVRQLPVRQLPAGILVPTEEMAKARERAAKRMVRGVHEQRAKGQTLVSDSNDYLVATFACREFETAPEDEQPANSGEWHGVLTYSVVRCLEQSASSGTALTYRELIQRVQANYLTSPQSLPTPTVEGTGQVRVVLGTDKPARPKITLVRIKGECVVNVGDLHGITRGSVLRVYSPAGEKEKTRFLGYVRVQKTRPLDSVVAAVAYEGTEKPSELPIFAVCEVVSVDYSVSRLRIGIEPGQPARGEVERQVTSALRDLPEGEFGLFELVKDRRTAQFLVCVSHDGPQLVAASGQRPPIRLPALDSKQFGQVLTQKLRAIHRARALIDIGARLEDEKSRGLPGPDVKIELLIHRNENDPGQVLERPKDGWVFQPGAQFSFRVTNLSQGKRLEVTILAVDLDYRIHLVPQRGKDKDKFNKALEPGAFLDTAIGQVTEEPPFGTENMIVIITAPTNPPVNYALLLDRGTQEQGGTSNSPLAQLFERSMYGSGLRSELTVPELVDQGARVLSWRTERALKK